jgi:hypothetical protein
MRNMSEQNANVKSRLPLVGGGQGRRPVYESEVARLSLTSDLFFFALVFLLLALVFALGLLTGAQALP